MDFTERTPYCRGLCLFGDHAGWVYCLEAASGRLVWQFQAAPEQRYMGAYSGLESSWPVRSGVLVLGDMAYFVAGRCGTMDGGLYVHGVDAATGVARWKRNFTDIRPTDVLRSDGKTLFFGVTAINPADGADKGGPAGSPQRRILMSSPDRGADISILDELSSLDPGSLRERKRLLNNGAAFGELVTFDSNRSIVSWRRGGYTGRMDGQITPEEEGRCHLLSKGKPEWINKDTGQQMQALLLAGPRVYGAGVPEARDSQEKPALWILSAADGRELQKIPLDSAPSIDGLSALGGKLILTTADGQVMCYGGK
jgi:outer membrane protein assembly factor BamB